jgi:hypothetical protein
MLNCCNYPAVFKFPKGIYVYCTEKGVFENPEGILCENRAREHAIPSGFLSNNSFCSINIDSLREFESDWIVKNCLNGYRSNVYALTPSPITPLTRLMRPPL